MIEEIRRKITAGAFEFTQHAVDQSILRRISLEEIREAVTAGEVIEDYPDDKYGPSCLILGYTQNGRPVHIHCSHPVSELFKIITVYHPDPLQWIDNRTRRPSNDM